MNATGDIGRFRFDLSCRDRGVASVDRHASDRVILPRIVDLGACRSFCPHIAPSSETPDLDECSGRKISFFHLNSQVRAECKLHLLQDLMFRLPPPCCRMCPTPNLDGNLKSNTAPFNQQRQRSWVSCIPRQHVDGFVCSYTVEYIFRRGLHPKSRIFPAAVAGRECVQGKYTSLD